MQPELPDRSLQSRAGDDRGAYPFKASKRQAFCFFAAPLKHASAAYENGPTWAQFNGSSKCAGMNSADSGRFGQLTGTSAGRSEGARLCIDGMTALLLGRAERSTPEARGARLLGLPGLTAKARAERQLSLPQWGRPRVLRGQPGGCVHRRLPLTRVIEPTGGHRALKGYLRWTDARHERRATLADAARFVGLMKPGRQSRPHWDFAAELLLKAAETGERRDIKAATVQMEFALRVEGWI